MTESNHIRVMTIDDCEILHSGIRFTLLAFDDLELVGEAHSGEEALHLCSEVQPDVVLMDMLMPEMECIDTTRAIQSRNPEVQVLVLTSFYDRELVRQATQAGAVGYLVRGVSADDLADAIRAAHAGRNILTTGAFPTPVQATNPPPKLGKGRFEREREVLALLAEGLPNNERGQTHILIAERQSVIRSAVSGFLRSQPDLDVVGEVDNSLDLLAQVEATFPDLMLLDWDSPGHPAPDLILALRHLDWQPHVIVLGVRQESARAALDAGADAFVYKGYGPKRLLAAIRSAPLHAEESAAGAGGRRKGFQNHKT